MRSLLSGFRAAAPVRRSMREGTTLPAKLSLPKLTIWDFAAFGLVGIGVVLIAANWLTAYSTSGATGSPGAMTLAFVAGQLVVCLGSVLLLGKTAHGGTLWGNLAAVGGMFVGMSGVLLAAALWAAA